MKNSILKKAVAVVLSAAFITTAFASCKKTPTDDSSSSSVVNPVTDKLERGEITNALHKVSVKKSSRTFVSGAGTKTATTEYKILADNSNSYALRAASFMAGQLNAATNASFKVEL